VVCWEEYLFGFLPKWNVLFISFFLKYVILCLIDIGLCISYFNIGILNLNINLRDLYI
jgi:hypothetical protein